MSDSMIILTRTYDLLHWLLPKTDSFPKRYHATVTHRLISALLDFQEELLEAVGNQDKVRVRHLRQASIHLDKLRLYLRLALEWQWLSMGQYEHISKMVAEVGRLLGGSLKSEREG